MHDLNDNSSAQKNLLKLLESSNTNDIELGLQLIPHTHLPIFLKTPLYFLALFHQDVTINKRTFKVLKPHLSSLLFKEIHLLQNQKKRNIFKFYLEKNLNMTFKGLEYFLEIDVPNLANYCLRILDKGLGYCLSRETDDPQKLLEKRLQKKNKKYGQDIYSLQLNDLGLTEIPKGLTAFQDLPKLELFLSGNPIQKVPESLKGICNISFVQYDNYLVSPEAVQQMEKFFPVAMAQNYVLQSSQFFRGRDLKVAIEHVEKALSLNPENILALNMLGNCYVEMENDYAKALQYYEQALKFNPTHIESWANKGKALLKMGRYDDVLLIVPIVDGLFQLQDYDKVHKETGTYFVNLFNTFSLAHLHLGNKNIALRFLEKAINIDVQSEETYFNQAKVYASLNQKTDMFQALEKVTELNPERLMRINQNPDFKSYRKDPQFQQFMMSLQIQLMNRI